MHLDIHPTHDWQYPELRHQPLALASGKCICWVHVNHCLLTAILHRLGAVAWTLEAALV